MLTNVSPLPRLIRPLVAILFALLFSTCQHQPSSANIDKFILLPSINMHLEGKLHPITHVPFERVATQRKFNGKFYTIVMPRFDALYEVTLPKRLFFVCDRYQFNYLNQELKRAVSADPALAERFSNEQLIQINAGKRPSGYTWHHDAPLGKMQLIDYTTHEKTRHTGGRWLWGGGKEGRLSCERR